MKKILSMLIISAFAVSAQASYLMWQVGADDVGDFDANAVRIGYSTDGSTTAAGYLTLQFASGSGLENLGEYVKLDASGQVPQLYASVDNLTGDSYSFFIELINYDSASAPATITTVAVSEVETYANLTDKGFTSDSMIPTVPTSVWHGGTYSAVPEPTGGLLVMFGLGLLALKRKRV